MAGARGQHRHRPARRAFPRVRSRRAWRRSTTRSPRGAWAIARCRVDEKRREFEHAADFTTEATDEVCSEGHPMGGWAATGGSWRARCSPRPLPVRSRRPRGSRRGPPPSAVRPPSEARPVTVGCSATRSCPPPPDPLPFEVACPEERPLHLERRAARWSARRRRRPGRATRRCLKCGSAIEATPNSIVPGRPVRRRTRRTRRRSPARAARPRAAGQPRPQRGRGPPRWARGRRPDGLGPREPAADAAAVALEPARLSTASFGPGRRFVRPTPSAPTRPR